MSQQHFVIVGAGIVGLSTAYALLKQGMKSVTILEQVAVDHRRATSHGISRLLRFEYGANILYSEMVELSLQRWRLLERVAQRVLYTETGVLVLGKEEDTVTRASYHVLRELGMGIERLSEAQVRESFPQFVTYNHDMFTYNPNAGMLYASNCLHALKDVIIGMGGTILENCAVERIVYTTTRRPVQVRLANGGTVTADRLIIAAGPWVHRLLGELDLPVQITRQYLLYFANLPVEDFAHPAFPAFIAGDLYGFPLHNSCSGMGPNWLKAASHRFGTIIDPEEDPEIEKESIEQIAQSFYSLIPALQRADLIHVDRCMYDVSKDEDFILDYHPHDRRIVFASGLTGHGFKFGPILGEILCSLARELAPPVPIERFRLGRFATQWLSQASSVA